MGGSNEGRGEWDRRLLVADRGLRALVEVDHLTSGVRTVLTQFDGRTTPCDVAIDTTRGRGWPASPAATRSARTPLRGQDPARRGRYAAVHVDPRG